MKNKEVSIEERIIITDVVNTFEKGFTIPYEITELFFYESKSKIDGSDSVHIFIFMEYEGDSSSTIEYLFAQYILTQSDLFNVTYEMKKDGIEYYVHAVNPKKRIVKLPEQDCFSLFSEKWFNPQVRYKDFGWKLYPKSEFKL